MEGSFRSQLSSNSSDSDYSMSTVDSDSNGDSMSIESGTEDDYDSGPDAGQIEDGVNDPPYRPPPRMNPAETRTYGTRGNKRKYGAFFIMHHYILNQVGLKRGLKMYKEKGIAAAVKEF